MRRGAAALLLAAALVAPAVHATTVIALDEQSLVRSSQIVALVFVESVTPRELAVGPGVFTDVSLRVLEPLLGGVLPGDAITVRIPGGLLGERNVVIEGMPSFAVGEELVVFLELLPPFPDGVSAYLPLGLNQGVWRRDPAGMYAPSPQDGLLHPGGASEPIAPGTIEMLRQRIRSVGVTP